LSPGFLIVQLKLPGASVGDVPSGRCTWKKPRSLDGHIQRFEVWFSEPCVMRPR